MSVDDLLSVLVTLEPGPPVEAIAAALGCPPDDAIAEAERAGLVESWELPTGPTTILTPLSCERLGVQLVEVSEKAWAWMPLGWKAPPIRSKAIALDGMGGPSLQASTEDGPLEFLILAERLERQAKRLVDQANGGGGRPSEWNLPTPHRLIGQSIQWPGPPRSGRPCPACAGRPLMPWELCLYCERWGMDWALPRRPALIRKTPAQKAAKALTRRERRKAVSSTARP